MNKKESVFGSTHNKYFWSDFLCQSQLNVSYHLVVYTQQTLHCCHNTIVQMSDTVVILTHFNFSTDHSLMRVGLFHWRVTQQQTDWLCFQSSFTSGHSSIERRGASFARSTTAAKCKVKAWQVRRCWVTLRALMSHLPKWGSECLSSTVCDPDNSTGTQISFYVTGMVRIELNRVHEYFCVTARAK